MQEPPLPSSNQSLSLTRGHLHALAVLSISLAFLAFFLGVQVGRRQAPPEPARVTEPLLPDEASHMELEELLVRVEESQKTATASLSFPAELPLTPPPPVGPPTPEDAPAAVTWAPPTESSTTTTMNDATAISAPIEGEVPSGAWSIRVFNDLPEAETEALSQALSAAGFTPFRLTSLVNGRAVHEVRVGGFNSREEADTAAIKLKEIAESSTPEVLKAP